ncbi:hypothetical protein [Ensifer canadensis]|uniref:hypothetical protein n=1 Tax=Ensifer canadensis TaxID=555315 RepID=UPI0035E3D80E
MSVATEPVLGVAKEMRSVLAFGQRVLEGSGLGPDTCDFMFGTPGTVAWGEAEMYPVRGELLREGDDYC